METNLPEIKLTKKPSEFIKVQITSSKDCEQCLRNFFFNDLEIYESFFLLLLDRANNTIGYVKISQGGIFGTTVDVKLIAKYAIESLASSVILCHNHPSGSTKPSENDINMTKKISNVLNLFDCKVLDHIILTVDSYYSFADEGLI